jgi:hypothetical protein
MYSVKKQIRKIVVLLYLGVANRRQHMFFKNRNSIRKVAIALSILLILAMVAGVIVPYLI